ncbi:RNA polymerase RPO19 [Choristoneura rosaceana entomopoxvirus 'L']|uniref:RNA polymerase RPO19 n=1 Tax=Choristoneura rosaceana entomopoxvirus 'L' TaxID=1293539 RepID=A0ABM9QKM1_9POXV|nr:RNA polymerase RPO19 [Choristoneura rosaceana entomopoxvirus 'L']CCU56078.1 RNA polymerase RPO19 [Choristoneura rosaceana entomopoxvirus 'L']
MSDVDYDDDQLEASDEEDIDDMIYSELCENDESDTSETNSLDEIIDYEELDINKKVKIKDKIKYFKGKIIDMNKISKAKDNYLYNIKLNELLSIFLNFTNILQNGGLPLIDEIKLKTHYNIELFSNSSTTPEMAAMIMLIIMNIPICVKKNNKIFNREVLNINNLSNDYINCYYNNIKNMLRGVTYNTNNKFDFDIFNTLFPLFIKNINRDILSYDELQEIKKVKLILSNNYYENL